MATINVTKALIAKEDVNVGNGTFTRTTSTGGTGTVNKVNLTTFAEGWGTFVSGDADPTVLGRKLWKTAGTTAITDFDDGVDGQEIIVRATDTIVITDNANIALSGGYTMTDTDTLTLVLDGTVWYEVSRSVN